MATNISQETVEALIAASEGRVSQALVELLNSASSANVSQITVEGLMKSAKGSKISQITIELVRPFVISPDPIPPRVYGTIIG